MPVYEYVCKHCGNKKEEVRSIASRDDASVCVYCGNGMKREAGKNILPIVPYGRFYGKRESYEKAAAAVTALLLFLLSVAGARAQYIGTGSDRYISGNITSTQSVTVNTQGGSTLTFNVTGTWTGTLTPEVTVDGTNWIATTVTPAFPAATAVSTITANGQWQLQIGSINQFRLRGNTVGSGTAVVFEEVGIGSSNSITGTISGTVAATQSGTWTVQPGNTANTTAWKVDGSAVTQPVSGTFWQATQPVSAASLPLPSGAATSALQPGFGTAGSANSNVVTVQGIASMTKLLVTPDSVALPANQSVNESQINGVTPLMGNGVAGTGSQRVTIASDNTAFTVNAAQSGTWTVQVGNTPNSTPILETPTPATSGGNTIVKILSAASNNQINNKASAGMVYQYQFSNTTAIWQYVHFYNKASTPTTGTDVPIYTVGVPPGGAVGSGDIMGMVFGTGIGYSITTGSSDTDNTSTTVGAVVGQFTYK